jgi:hypothetical protein
MQSVHEGLAHNCDLCNHKAGQKTNLNQHMQSVHEVLAHTCDLCDHKASQKINLN